MQQLMAQKSVIYKIVLQEGHWDFWEIENLHILGLVFVALRIKSWLIIQFVTYLNP